MVDEIRTRHTELGRLSHEQFEDLFRKSKIGRGAHIDRGILLGEITTLRKALLEIQELFAEQENGYVLRKYAEPIIREALGE